MFRTIRDNDIRDSLQTLVDEIELLEQNASESETEINRLSALVEKLETDNAVLEDEVDALKEQLKETEEALAEVYLTSREDRGE